MCAVQHISVKLRHESGCKQLYSSFNNERQSIMSEMWLSYANQMLLHVRMCEVRIQRTLQLANVDLGC